jgi:hypothetical protein
VNAVLVRAHLLNVIAYAALRVGSPIRAKRSVNRAARMLGATDRDAAEVRRLARALRPLGTCLSRSLALAAMLPEADVVIGWCPSASHPSAPSLQMEHAVHAHAWVEHRGSALCVGDDTGTELARLHGSD